MWHSSSWAGNGWLRQISIGSIGTGTVNLGSLGSIDTNADTHFDLFCKLAGANATSSTATRSGGAAELEGADLLEVLALEVEVHADDGVDGRARQHGGAVCLALDARGGRAHVVDRRRYSHSMVAGGFVLMS